MQRIRTALLTLGLVLGLFVAIPAPASAEPLGNNATVGCGDIATTGFQVDSTTPNEWKNMAILAKRAGWNSYWEITTAISISMPESRRCTGAHTKVLHPTGSEDSRGLMQVNVTTPALWDERRVMCGLSSKADLFDAQTNMNCAWKIYNSRGKSFGPWTTYGNGAYQQYAVPAGNGYNKCVVVGIC